jgi:hypothetical protein
MTLASFDDRQKLIRQRDCPIAEVEEMVGEKYVPTAKILGRLPRLMDSCPLCWGLS